MNKSLLVLI